MAKHGPRPKPLSERFAAKTRVEGDCLVWTGGTNGIGYGMLYDRDTGKKELTHRIAIKLVEGRYPTDTVLHLCDNPKCVKYAHLKVGSPLENARDMGLKGRGGNQWNNGLTREQAEQVRERYAAGESQQCIADSLGVDQTYISLVLRNRILHLLPDGADMPEPTERKSKPRPPRRPHRKRKLTEEQVQQIRSLAGVISRDRIAKAFDVHKSTITHIVTGKQWRDA